MLIASAFEQFPVTLWTSFFKNHDWRTSVESFTSKKCFDFRCAANRPAAIAIFFLVTEFENGIDDLHNIEDEEKGLLDAWNSVTMNRLHYRLNCDFQVLCCFLCCFWFVRHFGLDIFEHFLVCAVEKNWRNFTLSIVKQRGLELRRDHVNVDKSKYRTELGKERKPPHFSFFKKNKRNSRNSPRAPLWLANIKYCLQQRVTDVINHPYL